VRRGRRQVRGREGIGPQIGVAIYGDGGGPVDNLRGKANDGERHIDRAIPRAVCCALESRGRVTLRYPPRFHESEICIRVCIHEPRRAPAQRGRLAARIGGT
jgi:hypothetical protein